MPFLSLDTMVLIFQGRLAFHPLRISNQQSSHQIITPQTARKSVRDCITQFQLQMKGQRYRFIAYIYILISISCRTANIEQGWGFESTGEALEPGLANVSTPWDCSVFRLSQRLLGWLLATERDRGRNLAVCLEFWMGEGFKIFWNIAFLGNTHLTLGACQSFRVCCPTLPSLTGRRRWRLGTSLRLYGVILLERFKCRMQLIADSRTTELPTLHS